MNIILLTIFLWILWEIGSTNYLSIVDGCTFMNNHNNKGSTHLKNKNQHLRINYKIFIFYDSWYSVNTCGLYLRYGCREVVTRSLEAVDVAGVIYSIRLAISSDKGVLSFIDEDFVGAVSVGHEVSTLDIDSAIGSDIVHLELALVVSYLIVQQGWCCIQLRLLWCLSWGTKGCHHAEN